jgi:hypothetical protein
MHRVLLATLLALSATACAGPSVRDVLIPTFTYRPAATELVSIVDSPADIRTCRRLEVVSPEVATGPGFDAALQAMLERTVAVGGTHLYLQRLSRDWALVRGIAYLCDTVRERRDVVIRAKG